ncbi:MAG: outer membrane beta-barrel protein [Bacteroidota bacterium]
MRKILLVIVLSLASSLLFAQEGLKIGLRFSPIVAIPNATDSSSNVIEGLSGKVGLSYGLMINYGIAENFGIHTGVHIVSKGFNRTGTVTLRDTLGTVNATQNVRMTTLEIPLAVKGRSNEVANGVYISGQFGLSADISVGYKNEYTAYDPVDKVAAPSGTKNGSNLLNPVNFTFIFGPGVQVEKDFGTINAGIIYHRGLTNMNNKVNFGNQETIKMSYVSLDLGYFF